MNCILGSHSCADFTYSNGVLSCFTLVHTDLCPMQRSFKNPSFLQDCAKISFQRQSFLSKHHEFQKLCLHALVIYFPTSCCPNLCIFRNTGKGFSFNVEVFC